MKKTKKLDMWTVLSFVILLCYAVFLLYPMLNLLRQSVVTIDGAFTLEYFQKFFGKSYYLITLWNSFKVSIAVTIITLIIGVPLAYLYNMYEIKGKGLLQIIIHEAGGSPDNGKPFRHILQAVAEVVCIDHPQGHQVGAGHHPAKHLRLQRHPAGAFAAAVPAGVPVRFRCHEEHRQFPAGSR